MSGWIDYIDTLGTARAGFIVYPGGDFAEIGADTADKVVLPGAFNPLHAGHQKLLATARELTGRTGYFELALTNADKGDLARPDVVERVKQVAQVAPVIITTAALFVDKAKLLPNAHFVLGMDTLERLLKPTYYADGVAGVEKMLKTIQSLGCKFLVAGRLDSAENKFRILGDVAIPPAVADIFIPVPESTFRVDISSTELR